ncbi:hypothetical protein [Actinomadura atramentaria]|uniref:hypothetical protein n=1 Tax=Actinomadura atramentaria TaxID=1990 RepID=UPI00036838BF|nr:hypothetical protein [Actinomadura atramentaria]
MISVTTPRPRTGRRARRAALAGAAAAALVAAAGCASASDARPESTTFPLTGKVLDVRSSEPTDLVATDRADVRVTRWFSHRYATGVRKSWGLEGGVLRLRADCTGFANCEAKFRVEVPKGVRVLRDGRPTKLTGAGR